MSDNGSDPVADGVPLVGASELEQLGEGVQLIDVRSDHEWEAGRIPGAAHLMLNQVPERAAELDRERPVIVYCRAGNRSEMATSALRQAGYDARKLDGGIISWAGAGLPLEPDGGYVAESGEAAAILEARQRLEKSEGL